MRSRWRQGACKGQAIGIYDYKGRFELAERALYVAEPRFMSVGGRFMHLWCVSCGKAALFGYFMLSPKGGYEHTEIDKKV